MPICLLESLTFIFTGNCWGKKCIYIYIIEKGKKRFDIFWLPDYFYSRFRLTRVYVPFENNVLAWVLVDKTFRLVYVFIGLIFLKSLFLRKLNGRKRISFFYYIPDSTHRSGVHHSKVEQKALFLLFFFFFWRRRWQQCIIIYWVILYIYFIIFSRA